MRPHKDEGPDLNVCVCMWGGGGGAASSVSMESDVSVSSDTMQQLTIRLLQDNDNTQTPNDLLRTAGIIVTQTSVSADIS